MVTIDEIKDKRLTGNILIVGDPGVGKSTLLREMAKNHPDHQTIKTDAFMAAGYEEGLYQIMRAIEALPEGTPTLIEGVQGYRLLRKGLQTGKYRPDYVIEVRASNVDVDRIYQKEREGRDPTRLHNLRKANQTILSEYKKMQNEHPPAWLDVFNPMK